MRGARSAALLSGLLALGLALGLGVAACAKNIHESCDLVSCQGLCRSAGYVTGECEGSECHCSYQSPGNTNWNPWAIPDGGDPCGGCPEGQLCCGGECTEVELNNDHCGLCDRVCPSGEVCTNGWCMCGGVGGCIPGSEKCCNDECVNILYDAGNCGDCGVACQPDTGPECEDGVCVCPSSPIYGPPRACDGTYEDMCCEQSLLTMGGCFDLGNDREHCGACEISCATFEGQICLMGECTESLSP